MAEATGTSTTIQPVHGLVKLMNIMFVSLSEGADALFEIEQQSQSAESGFYHYNCCGELDAGWGCAYRALQTLISCIVLLRRNKEKGTGDDIIEKIEQLKLEDREELPDLVPSIRDIQLSLGITKPKQWIDPDYAHTYFSNFRVKGRVEQVWSNKASELEVLPMRILTHFDKERTPIMIDDAIYAYTLVGCAKILAKPDAIFTHTFYVLVLDPHTKNKYVFKDYKSIIETQHRASYTAGDRTTLEVAGVTYAGGDVLGTDGVYWLPFDVMFSKGAQKQFKIYYPYYGATDMDRWYFYGGSICIYILLLNK